MNRPTAERVERPPSSFFTHNPSSPATFPTPGAQCGAANARASRGKRTGPDRGGRNRTCRPNPPPPPAVSSPKSGEAGASSVQPAPVGVLGACWQPSRGPGPGGRRAGGSLHRTAQGRGGRAERPRDPPPARPRQQERFARLAHAHTQNNAGINAVLEPCGRA